MIDNKRIRFLKRYSDDFPFILTLVRWFPILFFEYVKNFNTNLSKTSLSFMKTPSYKTYICFEKVELYSTVVE